MTIRSKARLQETAGDLSEKMMKEWARVAEIIKPQITLGKPTRVASVMDSDTLIYCRARCNITAGQLKKLFKQAGYEFRYQRGEYEFSYA